MPLPPNALFRPRNIPAASDRAVGPAGSRPAMEASPWAWYNLRFPLVPRRLPMAKPHRGLKKANHGARPANSKARKAKRKHIKT